MSEFDDDEFHLREANARTTAGEGRATKNLLKRFINRGGLLYRWMVRIVVPYYWKPIIASMILRTGGTLAEAASFLVAAQLLIHWTMVEGEFPGLLDSPLLIGGGMLVTMLLAGTLCSYFGEKIAIRVMVDLETNCFVRAVDFVHRLKLGGTQVSRLEERDLFFSAPRFMGRTIKQCIGVGSSVVLTVVGAVVCVITFPILSAILSLIFLLTIPAYAYHAFHSTWVGHRFRDTAPAHAVAKKELYAKWSRYEQFTPEQLYDEAVLDTGYSSFMNVYGQRLAISPISQLIVNGTMAISILATLLWLGASLQLNSETMPQLVIYLVFVRVFFSGLKGIIGALQIIASFVPNYLLYLNLDPRMK